MKYIQKIPAKPSIYYHLRKINYADLTAQLFIMFSIAYMVWQLFIRK